MKSGFLVSFSVFNAAFDTKRYWLRPKRIRRRTLVLFLFFLVILSASFCRRTRWTQKRNTTATFQWPIRFGFGVQLDYSSRTKSGPPEAANCVQDVHDPHHIALIKGGGEGGRISMIQTVYIFFRECGEKIPIIVVSQSFFLFCITRFSAAGGTLFLTLKIGLNTKTRNATSRLVLFFGVQLGLWRSDTGNSPTHFNSWWLIIVADGVGYNDWLGCRRPSWTPKMKPNGYGLRTVWFRFWCSILDFWFRKECPT